MIRLNSENFILESAKKYGSYSRIPTHLLVRIIMSNVCPVKSLLAFVEDNFGWASR